MFGNIKDKNARNILRGMMDKNSQTDLLVTYNHLRALPTNQYTKDVFSQILYNPLFKHLLLPPPFPSKPVAGNDFTRPNRMPLERELIFQLLRVSHDIGIINNFIIDAKSLNDHIFDKNMDEVCTIIRSMIKKYGHSNFLLRKVGFLRSVYYDNLQVKDICDEIVGLYNHSRRDTLCVCALDIFDNGYIYESIRSTFDGLIAKKRISQTSASIVNFCFSPISYEPNEISDTLLSHGLLSVIDVFVYIGIIELNLGILTHFGHGDLVKRFINSDTRDLWVSAFSASLPHDRLPTLDDSAEYGDETLYRQTAAFFEITVVSSYRANVDKYYLSQSDFDSYLYDDYVSHDIDLPSICTRPQHYENNIASFNPKTAGLFTRTIALLALIKRGAGASMLSDDQLLALLNQTREVASIASASQIKQFFSGTQSSTIGQYLFHALMYDRTKRNLEEHSLRKIVQKIILTNFEGDIVKFASFLAGHGRVVAEHFVGMCSERFLVQLFDLYPDSSQVVEAKARLLDWHGTTYSEPSSIDRAKALRLELKLQKVRGDIDDTRLYVDPLRYSQWVQDNVQDEMQKLGRLETESPPDISLFHKANDPLEVMRRPHLRLASLLQLAFSEFCTNKFFGVDSYIGRRIRHGTLKGFMVTDVQKLMRSDDYKALMADPVAARFIRSWAERYEATIDTMGQDWFRIKSTKTPKGAIDPNILADDKILLSFAFVSDTMSWLQELENAATVVALVYDYCWILLEVDLKRLRRLIEAARSEVAVIDREALSALCDENIRKLAHEFSRDLNELTQSKFSSIGSWLTRPANLSPSAPVTLLIEAVIEEVRGLTYFHPNITRVGDTDIEIFGYRYHHLYDFLYVVIYNAAKHGKLNGPLILGTRLEYPSPGSTLLSVTVTSEIRDGDSITNVRSRVDDSMGNNTDDAMVVEINSGIAKIRKLELEVAEIVAFTYHTSGSMITFSFDMLLSG